MRFQVIMFVLIKMPIRFSMIKKKIHFHAIINISKKSNIYKSKLEPKIIWMITKGLSFKTKLLQKYNLLLIVSKLLLLGQVVQFQIYQEIWEDFMDQQELWYTFLESIFQKNFIYKLFQTLCILEKKLKMNYKDKKIKKKRNFPKNLQKKIKKKNNLDHIFKKTYNVISLTNYKKIKKWKITLQLTFQKKIKIN